MSRNFTYWNSHNLSHVSFRTPRSSKVKMNSDQYIVTVFSFKKSKNSKVVPDMESSFNSSVSTNYGPPLDYSFRNISSLEKLERHRPPRQSLRKQVIHWSKSNQSLALQSNLIHKFWSWALFRSLTLNIILFSDKLTIVQFLHYRDGPHRADIIPMLSDWPIIIWWIPQDYTGIYNVICKYFSCRYPKYICGFRVEHYSISFHMHVLKGFRQKT